MIIKVLQIASLPFNFNFMLAHFVPLIGIQTEQIVKDGTSWKYFLSELVLLLVMALIADFTGSFCGMIILATHLPLHVFLVTADFFNHQFVLNRALDRRLMGFMGYKLGLTADTLSHVAAGYLMWSKVLEWAPAWLLIFCLPIGFQYYIERN